MAHKPRILFYFLHLLGVGHVYRAKRLIDGFAQHGFAIDVIYGGMPLPDVELAADSVHYLPPIRAADNSFSAYLDAHDRPLQKPYLELRAQKLLEIFDQLEPDIVLTEAFPFGRRMIRHEMKALLDAVRQRSKKTLVVASIRDILQARKKPGRVEETCQWIEHYFDHVLVHSDPSVIRLDSTFPLADQIADKTHYTGFVVPPPSSDPVEKQGDVLVTAGGGAFGIQLLTAAAAAEAMQSGGNNHSWCISTGPNLPDDQFLELNRTISGNVKLTRYLPNLAGHMKQAQLSISQCGYNTAMDVLTAHRDSDCRAVFVPYDTEGQSEQLRRAQILEEKGYAICLPQSQLTAQKLLDACDRAANLPKVNPTST